MDVSVRELRNHTAKVIAAIEPDRRSPVEMPNRSRIRVSMALSKAASGMSTPMPSTVPGIA